jgi:gamma-glutamyl:cysteine ligase YbdK (ATP-grasp superfamily)
LQDIGTINRLLRPLAGRLMPTAMHPWMDPIKETRLWPHENQTVYDTFHRIFNCQGHGWSNLQSMHINLPFHGDDEFGRLHAAIRILLPILPALSASSPVMDGQITGWLDNRLRVYKTNCALIPSITGKVIPEAIFNCDDYQKLILGKIYHDLHPFDLEGILQEEWCNARGAIARFERNTIEIRVLDIQENPLADLAIAEAIIEVLRALCNELWIPYDQQKTASIDTLEPIFLDVIQNGGDAVIKNQDYLHLLGIKGKSQYYASEIWRYLMNRMCHKKVSQSLAVILEEGCLAKRIVKALGSNPDRKSLYGLYHALCDCLDTGRMFIP